MKKAHRSLILSLFALVLAISVTAASTFAWFSMNTTVTAKGMSIKAKSDTPFLQIVNASTDFDNTQKQVEASAVNATKDVRPTAVGTTTGEGATLAYVAYAKDTATANLKWVESFSNDPDAYQSEEAADRKFTDITTKANATDTTNIYTLINTFKVRLNPATGATTANNFQVSKVTIEKTNEGETANELDNAVRVLIVCGDKNVLYKYGASEASLVITDQSKVLADTVTTDEKEVKVYVFFDGEDENCKTNNALEADSYAVTIEFKID